jgi:hypothetical protein
MISLQLQQSLWHERCISAHMRTFLVASSLLVIGCESAPLQYQSQATFAATYGCNVPHVIAAPAVHRPGSPYDVFTVRGCGLRQTYYCAVDVGCMRPEEVSDPGGAPARTMPPRLVDPEPLPAPVLAPDNQSGS